MQIIGERFSIEFHQQIKETKRRNNTRKLLALCNDENFKQIKQEILAHSGTMGKWVTDYIRNVSKFLSKIAVYRDKNIKRTCRHNESCLRYYLHSIIKTTLGT